MQQAFICDALRTPIGGYGKSLSSVRPDDMAALVIRKLVARNPDLISENIDEVILGCANQAGEDNRNIARMSSLLAGLPVSVPGVTVNRLCASGLEAVAYAARSIQCGQMDLAIAGGVESMSRAPFVMGKSNAAFGRNVNLEDTTMGWRFVNPQLEQTYGVDVMPKTAENVAHAYNISREAQDAFAYRSHQKAIFAQKEGLFARECIPVELPKRKNSAQQLFEHDEHIREDCSVESLSRLRALFPPSGTVTAGNSSGINDGAAALIIASEAAVKENNLVPRARILGTFAAGVEPKTMGIGPVPACRKLFSRLNLTIEDFDLIELNEAFSSQALAVLRELGLDGNAEHVNPNGGAIALGHPLGMSGARLALTLTEQLCAKKAKLGLATLCVGVGMGLAMAIERV